MCIWGSSESVQCTRPHLHLRMVEEVSSAVNLDRQSLLVSHFLLILVWLPTEVLFASQHDCSILARLDLLSG